jgi:phosphatidylglycerophosphatase A
MHRKSTASTLARLIGTWFGCGLSPVAPGTVGTLGALPLFWFMRKLDAPLYWGAVVLISALGIWASEVVARDTGSKDPQLVVIDEVAGVLISLGFVLHGGFIAWGVAVILFRVFDIWKPLWIRNAERAKPPGLGIMLDDLVAGAVAGVLTMLFVRVLG